jgi:hypothetical protein
MVYAIVAALLLAGVEPAPNTSAHFVDVVKKHFAKWDSNHDGVLSEEEIDRLVVDPTVKGDEAAAAGSIKYVTRMVGGRLPPLTMAYFVRAAGTAPKKPAKKTEPADDQAPSASLDDNPWQKAFVSSQTRIRNGSGDLFRYNRVDLSQFHQGPLGDCYFVSMIGALVNRNPEQIPRMITAQRDGTYRVSFADNEAVTIPPLTDAEIAISSTTGEEGAWVALFEKAFGTLRQAQFPEQHKEAVASDAIARGGTLVTTIRVLTGHDTQAFAIKKVSTQKTAEGRRLEFSASPQELERIVRDKIQSALLNHKVIGAATYPEALPPGVVGRHAYAIIGYDRNSDSITVWNRHGNNFSPKGNPGLQHGYPTSHGVFTVPVKDFIHIFSFVEIENDVSATTIGVRSGKTSGGR